ncbi:transcriptional regulator, SARP family [Catenulispora acidiphila DSM 44928]|uniref:Transcriptional regulator, SARP family n=1 Tax=Catenulispora acidiphila (strain DSM 44928 / JCM 14897 / NBRC 102108 / NRRL B-24433 / ID139908) TaxID=479433 RepID=C7QG62_CATAD|nr:LysM peptidoglycan-binding domain-containing protein [Catenulispora acidiphila]ACU72907.1 transcriptional regulator, SARP family [Catenulispora acidiphila DSM 44928]
MAILQALGATARGITRVVKALLAAAITIGVLAGIPAALLHYAGDPIPHSVPTMDAVKHTLTNPMTPQMLLKALSVVGWYLWAILAVSFLVELVYAARRVNAPHIPTLGPTQALAAALIAAIGITTLLRAAPAHAAETFSASAPTGGRVAATAPALAGTGSLSTAHLAVGNASSAAPRESVHTVKPGESLYSIAKEDLGSGDDWPALYKMNAGVVQADGDQLTNPDLIRPDWKIRITPPSADQAPATTSTTTAPPTKAPAPSAPKASAPATSGPSALPSPAASHTAAPSPVTHATPTNDDHRQGDRAAKRHGGVAVSLPDGGAIGITLAVALGSALVLARRWRTRRADPRLPIAEPPLPGALLAARRAQRSLAAAQHSLAASPEDAVHDEEHDDLFDAKGIEDLDEDAFGADQNLIGDDADSWDDAEELDEFGAPAGPLPEPTVTRFAEPLPPGSIGAAERDGVELPLTPTGTGLGLVGPGAAGAARAIAASVLSAGSPERTADLARLIIPAADLAALLGVDESELPAITRGLPELFATKDLATAIGEAEVHALLRTRLLEEYEQPDLDALAAAHPDVEDCPPLVLMASPARALSAQIAALMNTSACLRITTVLLGAHPDGPTAFVEADGTATGPAVRDWSGARLWNLSAPALADILDLLARAAGHDPGTPGGQAEPDDWPETPPAHDAAERAAADENDGGEATITVLPVRPMPDRQADPVGDDHEERTLTDSPVAGANTASLAPVTMLPVRPAPDRALADAARTSADVRAEAALTAWNENPIRINVLGGLNITAGGQSVSGLRTSARVLAALLAVKGSAGASSEQIDAMCWPDANPQEMDRIAKWRADGLNSLRKRLAAAMGQRSPRLVLLDRATGRYRLNPELVATDLGTIAELTAAARSAGDTEQRLALLAAAEPLCRGALLDGELGDNFDWSADFIATVADEQVAVLARLATLAADSRPDQALAALEKAAAFTEDNETLYQQMFDILAEAGRHSEIPGKLRTLEAYADSLGAGVSTATREAAARAMKRQPQQGVRQGH